MTDLNSKTCRACKAGAPVATQAEIDVFLPQIPHWRIVAQHGIDQLVRTYQFRNFVDALDFTNAVGAIAEQQGHHPALLTEWGAVTVRWWTHKIKGLHVNDFIMAAKTDRLLAAGDNP